MGGHVALDHAARHPRAWGLVAIEVSFGAAARERRRTRLALSLRRSYASRDEAIARYRLMPSTPGVSERVRDALAEHSIRELPDGRFVYKFDPRWFGLPPAPHERLDDVRCPALVIRGAHSTLLTREGAESVVAKLPSARLIEISGAGHNVHLERPTEVIVAITEHLSAHARATGLISWCSGAAARNAMSDLLFRPLTEQIDALARRSVSAVELMTETLARIDATRATLNAFSRGRRPRRAARAGARRRRSGSRAASARPLEGIPLGVKDLEHARGLVTSMGSVPFQDHLASADSVQVARLRAAGAIVVGKTNVARVRLHRDHEEPAVRRDAQPVEPRAHAGRLVGRIGGRDRGRRRLARHRERRRRLGAAARLVHGLLRAEAELRPDPARAERSLGDGRHRRCTARSRARVEDAALFLDLVAGPAPAAIRTRCRTRASRIARCSPTCRAGCASAIRPTSATPWCRATSRRSPTTRRASSREDHRFEEVDGGPPQLGREWGLLGAFEMLGRLEPLLPEHEQEFGRGFLEGALAGAPHDARALGRDPPPARGS